jgi:hypothetical protein
MKIFIKTKSSAKNNKIIKINDAHFEVWVKEPAKEGKANEAVIKLVAEYLGIAKSKIKITHGQKSKHKTLEV